MKLSTVEVYELRMCMKSSLTQSSNFNCDGSIYSVNYIMLNFNFRTIAFWVM